MNYLTHIYLSGNNRMMQLGGFAADGIKGHDYLHYPPAMQRGVTLHRFIDSYTDTHPIVMAIKQELYPLFGRYAAVVLDLYFDYLLASRFETYTHQPLQRFALRFYGVMVCRFVHLPMSYKRFMLHFIFTNRLKRYASISGLKESMDIMVRVRSLPIDTKTAASWLSSNEERLRQQFESFFNELKSQLDTKQRSSELEDGQ